MKEKIATIIERAPKRCLAFSSLLFFLLAPFLFSLKEDYSIRIWFQTDDPLIRTLDKMETLFGNDDMLVLGLRNDSGVLTKERVEEIKEITERLWLLPDVIQVLSLSNYPYARAVGDEIIVEPFLNGVDQDLAELKKIAATDPILSGLYVDKSLKTTLLFARLKPAHGSPLDYQVIVAKLKELKAEIEGKGEFSVYLSGTAVLSDAYREVSRSDLYKVIPVMTVIVSLCLFIFFRSVLAIVFSMTALGMTTLATFGLSALFGLKFNNISSAVPGILMAICLADSVHFLMSYFRKRKEKMEDSHALKETIEEIFIPTLLTTISTMIGFFSLAVTELIPVSSLGILAGFGVFYAWILTLFFVAPGFYLLSEKLGTNFDRFQLSVSEQGFCGLLNFIGRWKKGIALATVLIILVSLGLGMKNQVNSEPWSQFVGDSLVRTDANFLNDQFGGVDGPHLLIHSKSENGIHDPDFLKRVDRLISKIELDTKVNRVNSILRALKQTNKNLRGNFEIPKTREEVAETLLFYEMGLPAGMSLNDQVSAHRESLRLSLLWSYTDSKITLSKVEEIKKMAKEHDLDLEVSGKLLLYSRMTGYIVSTFFTSIFIAFVLIAGLMMWQLGSVKLGLLSLIPNIVPLTIGLAVMSLFQIPIDMASSMIVCLCLGIAVDDTVHFLSHFRHQESLGHSAEEAIAITLRKVAPALILTTVMLCLSFSTFFLGEFVPNINFGLMSALILFIALLTDFVVLPAILLIFKGFSAV